MAAKIFPALHYIETRCCIDPAERQTIMFIGDKEIYSHYKACQINSAGGADTQEKSDSQHALLNGSVRIHHRAESCKLSYQGHVLRHPLYFS